MLRYKLEYFHKSTKTFLSIDQAIEEAESAIKDANRNIVQINIVEKRGHTENRLSTKFRGGAEKIRDLKL